MRTTTTILVTLGMLAGVARADISGTYEVKFDEVSTNCTTQRLEYKAQPIQVKVKGTQVQIDIDRTPLMSGTLPKSGNKVSAKSRMKPTLMGGMNGIFSVAGKITPEGLLSLVMVGEYSANGKPLCTQSWNVLGPKVEKPATPPKK